MQTLSEIGLVDTKKIIAVINDKYSIDFSSMALTSFKQRLINIMNNNNILYVDNFISSIESNSQFFEKCLSNILVDTTEMFRDPSLWREIKDVYLPSLFRYNKHINIHIPDVSSGDEVYSLAIILKESGFWEKVKLLVSSISQIRLNRLIEGAIYDIKKMEISVANSKRLTETLDISKYYIVDNTRCIMDKSILEGVEFVKHSYVTDDSIQGQNLILYRNRLIYYNSTLQDKVINKLSNSLAAGGYICFGAKENVSDAAFLGQLQCVNQIEHVYKKR